MSSAKSHNLLNAGFNPKTQVEEGFLRDNIRGDTHYHAAYIRPYRADSLLYLTTIGNHIFHVERGRQMASILDATCCEKKLELQIC